VSRPRFLADEDLRSDIVAATRRLEPSIEFTTVGELGWNGRPDPEVLGLAAEAGWLIVSHDVNTMTAHAKARIAAGEPMAGLLLAPQFRGTREIAESLVVIWSASEMTEWAGRTAFLPI
jgi:hypothetical protein